MLSDIRSVHFVGICGTAMASAAAAMQERGYLVTGSDTNVYPPMSTFLAERKVAVISGYDEKNLASKPDLVVIGNALSRGNPEVEAVLDRKLRYCSLPELLKEFFIRGKHSLVVSGTHGKTTTTSLSKTQVRSEVVVVLPCVPLTTMERLPRMKNSLSSSGSEQ